MSAIPKMSPLSGFLVFMLCVPDDGYSVVHYQHMFPVFQCTMVRYYINYQTTWSQTDEVVDGVVVRCEVIGDEHKTRLLDHHSCCRHSRC